MSVGPNAAPCKHHGWRPTSPRMGEVGRVGNRRPTSPKVGDLGDAGAMAEPTFYKFLWERRLRRDSASTAPSRRKQRSHNGSRCRELAADEPKDGRGRPRRELAADEPKDGRGRPRRELAADEPKDGRGRPRRELAADEPKDGRGRPRRELAAESHAGAIAGADRRTVAMFRHAALSAKPCGCLALRLF